MTNSSDLSRTRWITSNMEMVFKLTFDTIHALWGVSTGRGAEFGLMVRSTNTASYGGFLWAKLFSVAITLAFWASNNLAARIRNNNSTATIRKIQHICSESIISCLLRWHPKLHMPERTILSSVNDVQRQSMFTYRGISEFDILQKTRGFHRNINKLNYNRKSGVLLTHIWKKLLTRWLDD